MSRYDGLDLHQNRQDWLIRLDELIDELETKGRTKALNEKLYRTALSKELLKLTDVRSGTLKTEIAKGKDRIAELREQRDISVVLYNTCLQAIYQSKIELTVIETDYEHERRGR